MKTRNSHHPAYHAPKHQKVKGIRKDKHIKGDAQKLGSSPRQTEIEADRRQISILRKYIRKLKLKKVELSAEESRLRFQELMSAFS